MKASIHLPVETLAVLTHRRQAYSFGALSVLANANAASHSCSNNLDVTGLSETLRVQRSESIRTILACRAPPSRTQVTRGVPYRDERLQSTSSLTLSPYSFTRPFGPAIPFEARHQRRSTAIRNEGKPCRGRAPSVWMEPFSFCPPCLCRRRGCVFCARWHIDVLIFHFAGIH